MSGKFLVIVAVVLGAIVVMMLNSAFSDYEKKANPPKRTFYRASADIPPGITVGEAISDQSRLLTAVPSIPEEFAKAYPYAIDEVSMEYTKARRIVRPLKLGEYLQQDHLESLSNADLRLSIPEGQEAVTIGVSAETSVGYLLGPGDVVDIVQTTQRQDPKAPGGSVVEAKPVVSDVRIYAVDSLIGRRDGVPIRPRGTSYATVTITASHEDAMKVLVAKVGGKLTLVLKAKKAG